jgi:hypothetical protein
MKEVREAKFKETRICLKTKKSLEEQSGNRTEFSKQLLIFYLHRERNNSRLKSMGRGIREEDKYKRRAMKEAYRK